MRNGGLRWIIFICILLVSRAHAAPPELAARVEQTIDNVLRLESGTPAGNFGFAYIVAVTPDKIIGVTARHVVTNGIETGFHALDNVIATTSDNSRLRALKIVVPDPHTDIAVVEFATTSVIQFRPAVLAGEVVEKDEAWIFGLHRQLIFTSGSGRVGELHKAMLRINGAQGVAGSSGAPVFTSAGLAAIYSGLDGVEGTAIPVNEVRKLVLAAGFPWQLQKGAWAAASVQLSLLRKDKLRFATKASFGGGQREFPIPIDGLAPAGEYALLFDFSLASCTPSHFVVPNDTSRFMVSINCSPNVSGTWQGDRLNAFISEAQLSIFQFQSTGKLGDTMATLSGRLIQSTTDVRQFQAHLHDILGTPMSGMAVMSDDLRHISIKVTNGGDLILIDDLRR